MAGFGAPISGRFCAPRDTERSHAQIKAFEDTWEWDTEAAASFADAVQNGGEHVAKCMSAFRTLLGASDMLAYLSMMAPRLVELRRVMRETASIYLHCDSTASHYLKMLMDAVFRPENFRNEIIWKRRVGSSSAVHSSNRFGDVTDTILFYAKSPASLFHPQYNKDTEEYQQYIRERFTLVDDDGRLFQATSLVNPAPRPNLKYEYKGYQPPENGWMISKEKMEEWDRQGRIYFPKEQTSRLRRKSYADELKGMPIQNLWQDIAEINSRAAERLGYPTQKPEALLERIINASSAEGETVLDPFCGCGTAVAAAQSLERQWIGIDVTHLAIKLIKGRLADAFGEKIVDTYAVVGEPTDLESAKALADQDKYQFQYWALGLAHQQARPEVSQQKKGADKGIDGRLNLIDSAGEVSPILFSVKGGHVTVSQIRDLRGVVEREGAAMGVFICIEDVTAPMRMEAADAGFYQSKAIGETRHPKLQILTIQDLMDGKKIDMPAHADVRSIKVAPKAKGKKQQQHALPFDGEPA